MSRRATAGTRGLRQSSDPLQGRVALLDRKGLGNSQHAM